MIIFHHRTASGLGGWPFGVFDKFSSWIFCCMPGFRPWSDNGSKRLTQYFVQATIWHQAASVSKLYANKTLELAAIISEVSLMGQALRGKHTIPRICETADKPSYTQRKNDKRPHVWDETSGS